MSKRDIKRLGGLEQLLRLVEMKGEDSAKELFPKRSCESEILL